MTSPAYVIATEPLYIGTARAHNAGDRVLAANVDRNGWGDKVAPVDSPAAESAPGVFDPGARNVDDVLAHLAGADGAERDRVLAAERNGRARVTILGADQTE